MYMYIVISWLVEYVLSIVIIACYRVCLRSLRLSTLSCRLHKPFLEPYPDPHLLVMNESAVGYICRGEFLTQF